MPFILRTGSRFTAELRRQTAPLMFVIAVVVIYGVSLVISGTKLAAVGKFLSGVSLSKICGALFPNIE